MPFRLNQFRPLVPLLRDFLSVVRWRAWALVGLTVLLGLLQGGGLLMILPFLHVLGLTGTESEVPTIIRRLLETLERIGIPFTLGNALIIYVLVITINAGARYALSLTQARMVRDFMLHLQTAEFDRMLATPWIELSGLSKGDLLNRQMRDMGQVSFATQQSVALLAEAILTSVYLLAACQISVTLTLLAVGAGIVISFTLLPIQRRVSRLAEDLREENRRLFEHLGESFAALKIIKCFVREDRARADFHATASQLAGHQLRITRQQSLTPVFYATFGALFLAGFIWTASEVVETGPGPPSRHRPHLEPASASPRKDSANLAAAPDGLAFRKGFVRKTE